MDKKKAVKISIEDILKKDKVIKERGQCGSQEIRNSRFFNSHGFS